MSEFQFFLLPTGEQKQFFEDFAFGDFSPSVFYAVL